MKEKEPNMEVLVPELSSSCLQAAQFFWSKDYFAIRKEDLGGAGWSCKGMSVDMILVGHFEFTATS